jgi:hypothetical protein
MSCRERSTKQTRKKPERSGAFLFFVECETAGDYANHVASVCIGIGICI